MQIPSELKQDLTSRFNTVKLATTIVGSNIDKNPDRARQWIEGLIVATDRFVESLSAIGGTSPEELPLTEEQN